MRLANVGRRPLSPIHSADQTGERVQFLLSTLADGRRRGIEGGSVGVMGGLFWFPAFSGIPKPDTRSR
jgi:hypothetical protein